jgi:hypothetical protein
MDWTGCWGEYLNLRGLKWWEAGEKVHIEELRWPKLIIRWSDQRGWDGRVCSAQGRDEKYLRNFVGKPKGKGPLGRPRRRWENNIKMNLGEMRCGPDSSGSGQEPAVSSENTVMNFQFAHTTGNFLTSWASDEGFWLRNVNLVEG